jgi:DNA invertase Pin-like site-specific DNA recombinase
MEATHLLLGRSLQELVSFLGELHAKNVDLYLYRQGLDSGTPAGKASDLPAAF